MRHGTTPTHTFTLPFDTSLVETIQITYKQVNNIVLQKRKEDCVLNSNQVEVSFTQEETFKFNLNQPISIQVRILTVGGDAIASDIVRTSVKMCLDGEVLK